LNHRRKDEKGPWLKEVREGLASNFDHFYSRIRGTNIFMEVG
jgi:hypothetical protein